MELYCCGQDCIKRFDDDVSVLRALDSCSECKVVFINKNTPLFGEVALDPIDEDWYRCGSCGKRPLDAVAAHVLKIFMEEGISDKKARLKTVLPLPTPLYNSQMAIHLGEKSLVILDPRVTVDIAVRVISEVPEVKAVLKGHPDETVGVLDTDSRVHNYDVLAGCPIRCDIVQTPLCDIFVNKDQSCNYIEFPPSLENKLMILHSYFENKEYGVAPEKYRVLDATCGVGTLGIFSLIYGFKEVVFNDIYKPSTLTTAMNLEANGFPVELVGDNDMVAEGDNCSVYNLPIEMLVNRFSDKFDLCIIDCFPGVDSDKFRKIASLLARDVLVI